MNTTRTDWPLILLLWTTGLLAAGQFAKLTLTLDGLAGVYPGAPVPLAVSGVSVIGILGGAMAGFVVARIGARRSVLLAIVLSGAVSLVQGLAMPFAAFMATRIIEGVGHLMLVVALPTMMVNLARGADKPVVMGLWGTFFGVGYALLALVIPTIEARFGVQGVYLAHGVLLALLYPILARALPTIMAQGAGMPGVLPLHQIIYSNPRYFAPGIGHGIYTSIFIALVAFLPAVLGAAWLTVVLPLANLSGTFLSGFVARSVRASTLSVGSFAIAGLLFIFLGLTGAIAVALVAMFFTGLCAGANFAAVPEFNGDPQDQARANGAMAQIGNIGTFSGTPVYALFAGSLWGLVGVSLAICVAGVVIGGWAYAAARRQRVSAEAR